MTQAFGTTVRQLRGPGDAIKAMLYVLWSRSGARYSLQRYLCFKLPTYNRDVSTAESKSNGSAIDPKQAVHLLLYLSQCEPSPKNDYNRSFHIPGNF